MASKGQRWVVDSGILRKKGVDDEPQELLVFGYSCKLFRDDEKAKMIDHGKHLIPWMGDNELRIDRYDGRGALGDLKMYEPPPGGFDLRTFLTEDELKVEQFCDEERYRSLFNNDAEESMYHEEEMKRFHQALDSDNVYGQVAYTYNEEDNKKSEDSLSSKDALDSQEDDQTFTPPAELEIPEDMTVPDTEKLNAIITKTALFISRQGGQMEILIKAKQANNPQFSFLSIDGALYPYYRHVLEAIKSGKYNPEKEPGKEESDQEEESDEDDQPYLHPSLAPSFTKVEAAPSIPSIRYKPSADCAYSMLVNKITGKPPPSKTPQQQTEIPSQQLPVHNYYQQAQLQQTYAAAYSLPQQYSHGPVIYNTNGHIQTSEVSHPSESVAVPPSADIPPSHVHTKETPPSLVPYGPTPPKPLNRPSFIVPPADVQIIIEKMASYVAKNGRDFETIVKNKGDPRFNFLELSHQYHGYYAHKLTIYEGAINPRVLTEEELLQKQELQEEKQKKLEELQRKQQRMEEVQKRVKMIQAKKKGDVKTKQSITTVSFSIKKPKEGETNVIEKRSALPLEESDEEGEEEKRESVQVKPNSPHEEKKESEPEDTFKESDVEKKGSDDLELVDLTDDILENIQKETRDNHAEDKLKDGLTSKDKGTSRERQLQLERKRKAAAFLSQIQSSSPMALKNINASSNSKRDDDEVSSVPSPTVQADIMEIEESSSHSSSLMNRLKSADLESKRPRYRSRSRSGSYSYSDRQRISKKHKKKKSSHKSYYDSPSSSRSHKSKKSKKSVRHRSRSPSRRHSSSRHSRKDSSSSKSMSTSP